MRKKNKEGIIVTYTGDDELRFKLKRKIIKKF